MVNAAADASATLDDHARTGIRPIRPGHAATARSTGAGHFAGNERPARMACIIPLARHVFAP